jgi:hypothetical protein
MVESESTVDSDTGNEQNTVLTEGAPPAIEPQTPDQFYTGEPDPDAEVDPAHATEGMTTLGYSEASRIENTTAAQEEERAAYEAAHPAPEAKSSKKA